MYKRPARTLALACEGGLDARASVDGVGARTGSARWPAEIATLVVLEDERLRGAIAGFLHAEGLEPDEAASLDAAMAILASRDYQVIFSGESLAGLIPSETAAFLRRRGGAGARLVALTRNRQPDRRLLAGAGFDHVLTPASDADEIAAQYLVAPPPAPIPLPTIDPALAEERDALAARVQLLEDSLRQAQDAIAQRPDEPSPPFERDDVRAVLDERAATLAERERALTAREAQVATRAEEFARESATAGELAAEREQLDRERAAHDAQRAEHDRLTAELATIAAERDQLAARLIELVELAELAERDAGDHPPVMPALEPERERGALETLRTLTFYLARGGSPERKAQHALHAVIGLVPAVKAAIWLVGPQGVTLVRSSGLHPRYADLARPLVERLVEEPVVLDGRPRVVRDATAADRPLGEIAVHEEVTIAAHIPVVAGNGIAGVLAAYGRHERDLDDEQQSLLHAVADLLATALSARDAREPAQAPAPASPVAETSQPSLVASWPEPAFVCDADGCLVQVNAALASLLQTEEHALAALGLADLLEPDDAELIAVQLAYLCQEQPDDTIGPLPLELGLEGGQRWPVDLQLRATTLRGKPAVVGVVRPVGGMEADPRERPERDAALALLRASAPQLAPAPLEEQLRAALHAFATPLGYEAAGVWLLDADSGRLVARATLGNSPAADAAEDGIAWRALKLQRPVLLADASADRSLALAKGMTSASGIPLQVNGELAGVLTIESGPQRPLDERDQAVLTALAVQFVATIERDRIRHELHQHAWADPLTGLDNRQSFQRGLDAAIRRARRARTSVLTIGVDGFRTINELYGNEIGDDVLRQLAGVLRSRLTSEHLLARYTSDEFAVLLPDSGRDEAVQIAEDLRIAVATQLFTAAEQVEQLTVSIGAATRPDDATTAQGLLQAADHAMYLAKRAGRNQVFQTNAAFATLAPAHGRLNDLLRQSPRETLSLLIRAMDQRLPERAGHSERVTRYALAMARALAMDEDEIPRLRLAAYIHDVGMVSLPDSLLRKPTTLSPQERELLRGVPVAAHGLLSQLDLPESVSEAVLHQRERWDGSGYPEGQAGEEIPLGARIIAVADAIDAMTSARAHREPKTMEQALAEIALAGGTQFDPAVVAAAHTLTAVVTAPNAATTELGPLVDAVADDPTPQTDRLEARETAISEVVEDEQAGSTSNEAPASERS